MRIDKAIEEELRRFLAAHPPRHRDVAWDVAKLLKCVHARLFDPELNVRMLKDRCGISDNNVSCRFKRDTGRSIKKYIEALRMEAARTMLEQDSFSISQVAYSVGYNSLQTFYRASKRHFGCAPGALRGRRLHTAPTAAPPDAAEDPQTLTSAQRRTLQAAMERVLPAGEGPGATQAHAIGLVDSMVDQPEFSPLLEPLHSGLLLTDSLAVGMWGKSFPSCEAPEQDAVLKKIQDTPHPTIQRFFSLLVNFTLAGFLCSPAHGGNRNGVGWDFIGYTPHPLTGGAEWARASGR